MCDAVISGSTTLHYLLPENTTEWTPTDLDIYVPERCYPHLRILLKHQCYEILRTHKTTPIYSQSAIASMVTWAKGNRHIDVIVSNTEVAVSPIFQFHSTAVMNFISADHIFCAYPALTLRGLSIVNPGVVYYGNFKVRYLKTLAKYSLRGFRYVACKQVHDANNTCKLRVRSLTDGKGMWVQRQGAPHVTQSPQDLFWQLGVYDVHWLLGGQVCESDRGYVSPWMGVVEDAS
ncbi:hypothetical protein M404DRAFT_140798 [Pisolithus tinctorius Marx 270]|uniref:Uncharacterized protein n=1 Tax=Pisolithus tinctorius Marx 270 TaxID=870435 RepID=A0A0C3PBX6_PISTI|nr:hypothetical protein M404DRAFT_140798 [Pisolithus tinctorius Marx 270]